MTGQNIPRLCEELEEITQKSRKGSFHMDSL